MTQTKRKTNKILLAVLSLVFVLTVAMGFGALRSSATTTTYADTTLSGEGTVASPYLIGTKADLQQFADIIGSSNGVSACAKLTSDIDLKDGVVYLATWYSYKGTFDGNGYAIYNLSRLDAVSNFTNGCVGLFDNIDGATIKNLTVRGTITSSSYSVGGIVGRGTGAFVIKNCVNEVNVTARGAGGVIYNVYNSSGALIEDCVNKGTVRSNKTVAGGIIGYADYNATSLTVRKCYNSGTISADNVNVGGIAGVCYFWDTNIITDCYNTGAVTASNYVGGIVGVKNGSADSNSYVRNCHNRGTVTMTDTPDTRYIGGVSGFGVIALENCYYLSGCVSNGTDGATALSAAQMKVKSNFANWDFEKVWDIEGNYPILRPSPVEVEFDQNVLLNGETSTTTVSNLNGETAATLLTEEELGRYSGGESVNIYLEVNNESGSTGIPAEDKSVAKAAVASAEAKEGAYLDLKLYKQLSNDTDRTAIHESATAFDITVDIPAELAAPYGYTRTYSIVRVHNGVAETLESTVSDGKISFSTDKFSTYLIAYSDEFDANGEYIEFTTDIDDPIVRYVDDNNIANEGSVTVTYKITRNDGFNSILLIPEYDKNVFAIASDNSGKPLISVNNTALGAATITEGNGTMKILLENTGDKYTALDGDNEYFLTVTYRIIAAVDGEYNFGLVLTSNVENGESAAYYIAEANEQKGEQNRVGIKVIMPETLTLIVKQEAVITIGNNVIDHHDTDSGAEIFIEEGYVYTYAKTAMSVEKVDAVTTLDQATDFLAEYTYNGDGAVHIVWYNASGYAEGYTKGEALGENVTPMYPGCYYLGVSADASSRYYAVEEVTRLIYIKKADVTVTTDNKTSAYGDALLSLNYTVSGTVYSGDSIGTISVTTTVQTDNDGKIISAPGEYNIISNWSDTGAVNRDCYNLTVLPGLYTVTKREITIKANDITHEFAQTENLPTLGYTVTSGSVIAGDTFVVEYSFSDNITGISGSNSVGTYYITPLVGANTYYNVICVNGTYIVTSAAKDAEYFEPFFTGDTVTYNGNEHNLLVEVTAPDAWWQYTASGNVQINAKGTAYVITVTITVKDGYTDYYTIGNGSVVLTVDGYINRADVTITVNNVSVYYGEEPVVPNFVVDGTTEEIDYSYVVKNNDVTIIPAANTPVGVYDIDVTEGTNPNFNVTCVDGTYTVNQATAAMVSIEVSADDVYYNRNLSNTITVTVNNVTLDSNAYTVTYLQNNEVVTPVNAGEYTILVTVIGTDNYVTKNAQDTFEILRVKLEGVNFTYNHGNVVWTAVANDIGKTADETGVDEKALKDGTSVTYKVYDANDALKATIASGETLTFDAAANTTYYVVATASDSNYIESTSTMVTAHMVTFTEGDHSQNPGGVVANVPGKQYIFDGETVVAPAVNPSVDGCTFAKWNVNDVTYNFTEAVKGNITVVAVWDEVAYTITIKYLDSSETVGTDVFTLELYYGDSVDYSALGVTPVKASDDNGIYYTFANKWTDTANTAYDAVNDTISGFIVTGDITFVAVFDTNYNSFTITYYFSDNEATTGYTQFGDAQEVTYNEIITYRNYTGLDVTWFVKDYWYANEARTESVPVRMPARNISVYGTYKFDIGQGDVNADGKVNADDIAIYRQWIVGGYEMTVVESGTEWALVSGGNYNAQTRYYLKRVADNNADESKDIRDVSITRMAIVGGYDWDISTGEVVTGANIGRTKTATTVASVISGLTEYGRARMYADASATTDVSISANGNMYLDLGGNTLTVKSFVLNATDKNATITVKNGTIITTDGITITAPYGNVILENLTGYVGEEQVNLQAADSSLHFAGTVRFYKEQAAEPVAVPVYVAENTHVVVEQAATLAVEKVIVATVANNNEFVAAPAASITIDNKTANEVVIDGMVSNTVSTLAELIDIMNNGGNCVLGADISYSGTLVFTKDTSIVLNGHELRSSDDSAMSVKGNATLTISGNGNVAAQEVCVLVLDGATAVINGGTYTSIDNFVVGTNGTAGRGENKITINGGTFNGGITSNGYVACGIYVANSDTVIVNGGAFNITNGVGILARSGNTTVGENVVFNVTGSGSLGKVGDSRVVLPSGQVLVVDLAAGYPGGEPTLVNNSANKVCYIVKDEAGLNAALSNGGEVVLVNDIAITATAVINSDATINLNGHDINANGVRAIWVKSGDVEIKGEGIISVNGNIGESSSVIRVGDSAANADTAKLTIGADVAVSTDKCYGVTVFGTNQAALVVNGKIEVTGNVSAISGNGSANLAATSIVINDGAVVRATANNAIYHPQAGTLTVNGGEIVGLGGIEAKGGNVVVNGGTITATAPVASHNVNNNGSSTSGYAVVAVENSGYKGEGNFTIAGGTINGAVAVIEDTAAVWNPAITISGGTFSADPSAYVAENSVVYEESGDYVVVSAVVNSLSELTDAIANGRSKIVLGADITLTSTVIITNDVVINLNGHNITANGVRAIWVKSGDVEIKGNGTISVNGNIDSSSSVIRVGDGAANADTAKLTIGADVAVSTDKCYGITVFGKNAEDVSGYGQYLVVNGMVAVTGESTAISGNGTGELAKTNITVNNGATVKADDAGIYHPQGGTLTVNNGATVEGGTALYIKSGTVNIADGAIIKATKAEYTEYYYNGNGDNITGDAIVIDNCYYPNGNAILNFGANLANTVTVAATGASKVATYWFVKTESQLKAAVSAGGYLTIGENINLTEQIVVDKELTINLNGKTISNLIDIWNDADGVKAWSLISVQAGSLTVTGNGTLQAKANDCYALDVRNGAALTIENGTYVGNISAVYVIEGTLTVNGGTFSIQQKSEFNDCRYLLNCLDAPYKNGTATITVTGGSFVDFNPADCAAEGVNTNFVAAGYTITEINGVYTVSKQ